MMNEKLNGRVKHPESIENLEIEEQNTDNSNPSFEWDIEKFEKLLKYSNDTKLISSSSNETALEESEESEAIETDETDANYQFDSNDDPHKGKTKPTLAGNPFAKFGIVGTGFGAIFLIAALILNAMGNLPKPGIPQAPTIVDNENQKEEEKIAKLEESNARLKALIALGNQAQKIQNAQEELEKPQQQKLKEVIDKSQPTLNNNVATQPKPPRINQSPYPQTKQEIRDSPPIRVATRGRGSTSQKNPTRNKNVNPPIVSTPTPVKGNRTALKSPNPQPSTPKPNTEKVNPTEQWMAINSLGSYGSIEQKPSSVDTVAIEQAQNELTSTPQDNAVVPKATLVKFPNTENQVAISPLTLDFSANNVNQTRTDKVRRLQQRLKINSNLLTTNQETVTQNYPTSDLSPNPDLERSIITGIPTKLLRVGMNTWAETITPMVWAGANINQTKSDESNQRKSSFVVRLTKPIQNRQGEQVIPAGSEIVGTVQDVNKSGYATVSGTRLVIDNREYVLPKGAVSISGEEGKPLIASRYKSKKGKIASRDARTFLLGSLAQIGRVLNEPEENSSIISTGTGISTSSTSVKRGERNILGAVLEGGFTPLTRQILSRNQAAIREMLDVEEVWYIRPGKNVQVVVNQSFEL
ncbi:MAG: TrbI/VirB10 family protein [Cyanobacteria bacterium P01_A01_bin.84]